MRNSQRNHEQIEFTNLLKRYQNQVWSISGMQVWFSINTPIHIIQHFSRRTISYDHLNRFRKWYNIKFNTYSQKNFNTLGKERMFINLIKGIHKKPGVNVTLDGEC